MGQVCFFCGFRPAKKSGDCRSLHSLAAKEEIRFLWIKVCGLEGMVDENPNLRICSAHFNSEDYIDPKAKEKGSRNLYLKPNVVPSVSVPHPKPILKRKPKPSLRKPIQYLAVPEITTELSNPPSEPIVPQQLTPLLVTEIMDSQSQEPESVGQKCTITSSESQHVEAVTPKKRRFAEPRYVNEITPLDLATPRRTRRALDLIKSDYKKKSKEIKRLQDKTRYLQKRIKSLKDLVKHLQQKGLMSEEAGNTLMVHIQGILLS